MTDMVGISGLVGGMVGLTTMNYGFFDSVMCSWTQMNTYTLSKLDRVIKNYLLLYPFSCGNALRSVLLPVPILRPLLRKNLSKPSQVPGVMNSGETA